MNVNVNVNDSIAPALLWAASTEIGGIRRGEKTGRECDRWRDVSYPFPPVDEDGLLEWRSVYSSVRGTYTEGR